MPGCFSSIFFHHFDYIPLICIISTPLCRRNSINSVTKDTQYDPVASSLDHINLTSKCPAIIPISSCAAKHQASPSAASATSAMANAPSVTPTSDRLPSPASATSARLATTRTSASSAAVRESVMPFTVSNVRGWKKTATDVRRSSTWVHRGQICSTRRKISGINNNTDAR